MGVYDPIECYTLHVTTSSTAFTKSAEAGIPGTPEADKINVYPNPARNNLNIDIVSGIAGNASVSLINANGQSILEKEIRVTSGYTHTVLDASSLPGGIYFVRITTDKEVTVRKIVIQK